MQLQQDPIRTASCGFYSLALRFDILREQADGSLLFVDSSFHFVRRTFAFYIRLQVQEVSAKTS
jgi:hypothetical protein